MNAFKKLDFKSVLALIFTSFFILVWFVFFHILLFSTFIMDKIKWDINESDN
jgi:hypothetical protein